MEFSWKKIFKMVGLVLVVLAFAGAGFFITSSRNFQILYANVVKGNKEHFFDCYKLPFFVEVEKSLENHNDILEKLKTLGTGQAFANKISCKGWERGIELTKGELVVHYENRAEKLAIEKLIGDNFFGIPWRGVKD
jgi:hypothetical protein